MWVASFMLVGFVEAVSSSAHHEFRVDQGLGAPRFTPAALSGGSGYVIRHANHIRKHHTDALLQV